MPWDELVQLAASGGVATFNGRSGIVTLLPSDVAAVLPSDVAYTDKTNTFTANQQINASLGLGVSPLATFHSGDNSRFIMGSSTIPTGLAFGGFFPILFAPKGEDYFSVAFAPQSDGYAGSDYTWGYIDQTNGWHRLYSLGAEINDDADITTRDFFLTDWGNQIVLMVASPVGVALGGNHAISDGSFFHDFAVVALATGEVGVGAEPTAGAGILQITSTSQGLVPPRMTTTQKDAISGPTEGTVVYDTTLHKLCVYTGSAWETVTSA